MMLVSIGDQVREGSYPFHSRFRRAVNFRCGSRLVSLVDEQVGDGPQNIVIRDFDAERISSEPAPLLITANTVGFGPHRLPIAGNDTYCSTVLVNDWDPDLFDLNLSVLEGELRAASPPKSLVFLLDESRLMNFRPGFERAFTDQIRRGLLRIVDGHILDGVRTLKGCGLGLTPSGDDFIAGLLIGLNLLRQLHGRVLNWRATLPVAAVYDRRPVFCRGRTSRTDVPERVRRCRPCQPRFRHRGALTRRFASGRVGPDLGVGVNCSSLPDEIFRAAKTGNVFSNAFLDLARRGLLFGRMKNLVCALLHEDEVAVRKSAANLLAIGGSSGADLGTGFLLTVRGELGIS